MILCAVDDLMFTSKLRAAATHAGASLKFVRSPEALLSEARETRPALIILDLNADRLHPLDMLTSLRADPDLAAIRTVAFVAHTHVDRISAARDAGADEVMPRSAFVTRLPELLRTEG